jgi:hypothetical protein
MKENTVALLIGVAVVVGVGVHALDASHYSKQDTQDNTTSLTQESRQFSDFQALIQGIYPNKVDCTQFGYQPDIDYCNSQNKLGE